MSYNQITGVIPSLSGGLPALKVLNLANNQFQYTFSSGNSPANFPALISADYSNNQLSGALPSFPATIQNLNFGGNNNLTLSSMVNAPALVSLDLSRNGLTDLSNLSNLTGLRVLILSGNQLSSIGNLAAVFPNLVKLDLSQNKLASVNISNTQNLNWLNLAGNRLTTIPSLISSGVVRLNLSGNSISSGNIDFGGYLAFIDLSSNKLSTYPDWTSFTNLVTINLSNNNLGDRVFSSVVRFPRIFTEFSEISDELTVQP